MGPIIGSMWPIINEARLSHLPFWGPSEAVFVLLKRRRVNPNETFASPRLTQEFTRTLKTFHSG